MHQASRSSGRPRPALAGVGLALLIGLAGLATIPVTRAAAAGTTTTTAPAATATPATTPACAAAHLRVDAVTNGARYGPGSMVRLTASATNRGSAPCSVAVGPSWPALSVSNAHGAQVWNDCSENDLVGACPQFLALRTLAPGASYVVHAQWDQGAGPRRLRVPLGLYRFTVALGGVTSRAATFVLARRSSSTTVVTQLDGGRSVNLVVGDRLVVRLAGSPPYAWSAARSTNPPVLLRTSGGAGTSTTTVFVARRPGRARVTALETPNCYPQCLAPSRAFTLGVAVAP